MQVDSLLFQEVGIKGGNSRKGFPRRSGIFELKLKREVKGNLAKGCGEAEATGCTQSPAQGQLDMFGGK